MRKRWRLIIFGFLTAIVAAIALWPRTPDEFDVLRRFHPEETVAIATYSGAPPGSGTWQRKFKFKEMTPEVCSVLGITYKRPIPSLSFNIFRFKDQFGSLDSNLKEVTFDNQPKPSWLELQISAWKYRLGW